MPVLTATPGISIEALDAWYRDHDAMVTPELRLVTVASVVATLLTVAYAGHVLWKHVRPDTRARTRAIRAWSVAVVITANVVTIAAAVLAIAAVNFDLFGPSYLGVNRASPDGTRVAYLYRRGLFCGYEIHTRARGSIVLRKHAAWDVKCAERARMPTLTWRVGNTEVEMIDRAR